MCKAEDLLAPPQAQVGRWHCLCPLCSNTGVKGNAARHPPRKRRSYSLFMPLPFGEGSGTPLQYSCLENPMDKGAWWAAVHGVAKSRTGLSDLNFTFHFYALEKEIATHSSVLAWRIPGTEEPGGLPSMGSQRVGHDWSDLAVAALAFTRTNSCQVTGRTAYFYRPDFGGGDKCNFMTCEFYETQISMLTNEVLPEHSTCVCSRTMYGCSHRHGRTEPFWQRPQSLNRSSGSVQ